MVSFSDFAHAALNQLAITAVGFAAIHATAWIARATVNSLPPEYAEPVDQKIIKWFVRVGTVAILANLLLAILAPLGAALFSPEGAAIPHP